MNYIAMKLAKLCKLLIVLFYLTTTIGTIYKYGEDEWRTIKKSTILEQVGHFEWAFLMCDREGYDLVFGVGNSFEEPPKSLWVMQSKEVPNW